MAFRSTEFLFTVLLLANFALASAARLPFAIKLTAVQGWIIGLLPLTFCNWSSAITASAVTTAATNIIVKGIALPLLLSFALNRTNARKELEPFVSFRASLIIVFVLSAASFVAYDLFDRFSEELSCNLALPVSFTTIGTGLFLIVSRRKAITQVLGFLVFENGISAFGTSLMTEYGMLVELGILLDVFVLVFIFGITIHQISRTFSSTDIDRLNRLGDTRHLHLKHGKHA